MEKMTLKILQRKTINLELKQKYKYDVQILQSKVLKKELNIMDSLNNRKGFKKNKTIPQGPFLNSCRAEDGSADRILSGRNGLIDAKSEANSLDRIDNILEN